MWSWGSNSRLHTCQVRAPTLTQINNCKVASGTFTTLYNHSCYLGPKHFVTQKEALPSSSPYSSFALLPDRSDHNLPSHHRLSGRVSWTQRAPFLSRRPGQSLSVHTQGTRRWYGSLLLSELSPLILSCISETARILGAFQYSYPKVSLGCEKRESLLPHASSPPDIHSRGGRA